MIVILLLLCVMFVVVVFFPAKSPLSKQLSIKQFLTLPDLLENQYYNSMIDKDKSQTLYSIRQTHKSLITPNKTRIDNCQVPYIKGLVDSNLANSSMKIHDGIMDDQVITVPAYAFWTHDARKISNTVGSNIYTDIFTHNPISLP